MSYSFRFLFSCSPVGFPIHLDFTCAKLQALAISEFNCAQFCNNDCNNLKGIARNLVQLSCVLVSIFDNIQLKPHGTQKMHLIIAEFLLITRNSI